MAPAYKFTYLDIHALGEPIRYLFAYGGIEFEDIRLTLDQWPAIKPTTPFGQVPILEHKGKVSHQSIPIGRYVAKQVKLYGGNDWQDLEIDAIVDTITDLRSKIQQYSNETDEAKKESLKETLFNETLPFYLKKFDEQVKNNKGYFVAGKLTWADVYFVALLEYLDYVLGKNIIAGYANLEALKSKVLELPKIKGYLAKRAPFSMGILGSNTKQLKAEIKGYGINID